MPSDTFDDLQLQGRTNYSGDFYDVGVQIGGQFFPIASLPQGNVDEARKSAQAAAAEQAQATPAQPATSGDEQQAQPPQAPAEPPPPAPSQM